ncbi:MAG: hypothetical protein ABJM86_04140, partial [Hyphomicrobiales bacterium]
ALRWQRRGQGFDSPRLHQTPHLSLEIKNDRLWFCSIAKHIEGQIVFSPEDRSKGVTKTLSVLLLSSIFDLTPRVEFWQTVANEKRR